MSLSGSAKNWSTKLTRNIPPGQFGRYLLVGAWNTLFGYGSFAFFTAILSPMIPYSYIVASVISSLLNISVSYLGYKWFVFKTRGNYLREWLRCVAVYSGGIVFGSSHLTRTGHGHSAEYAVRHPGALHRRCYPHCIHGCVQLRGTQEIFLPDAGIMRVLITGGSGFIGRNLAEQFASTYKVSAPSSAELDLLNEQDAARVSRRSSVLTSWCMLPLRGRIAGWLLLRTCSTAIAACFSISCAIRD
jgi:putative flippase GtrA